MADLLELLTCRDDDYLTQRVLSATIIAAESVRTEAPATPNHAGRMAWAKRVFEDPTTAANAMVWAVLAQNHEAPLSAIKQATDAQVQAAVDAAVSVFAS